MGKPEVGIVRTRGPAAYENNLSIIIFWIFGLAVAISVELHVTIVGVVAVIVVSGSESFVTKANIHSSGRLDLDLVIALIVVIDNNLQGFVRIVAFIQGVPFGWRAQAWHIFFHTLFEVQLAS